MDLLFRPTLDLGDLMLQQLVDPSRRKLIGIICDALRAGVITTERATQLLYETWMKEFPTRPAPTLLQSWDS